MFSSVESIKKIKDSRVLTETFEKNENVTGSGISSIDLGKGNVYCNIEIDDNMFYKILGENTGFEISGKETLLPLMTELARVKKEYDKIEGALSEVREVGYGIVAPTLEELSLEEPEIVRQGSRYGVRLKAAYDSGDREALALLKDECDVIIEKLTALRIAHRKEWMEHNKPFGWEVHDIRYGGLIARFDTVKARLSDYLNGDIDEIGELACERIAFKGDERALDFIWASYQILSTASKI